MIECTWYIVLIIAIWWYLRCETSIMFDNMSFTNLSRTSGGLHWIQMYDTSIEIFLWKEHSPFEMHSHRIKSRIRTKRVLTSKIIRIAWNIFQSEFFALGTTNFRSVCFLRANSTFLVGSYKEYPEIQSPATPRAISNINRTDVFPFDKQFPWFLVVIRR